MMTNTTTRVYLGKTEVAHALGVHEQAVHAMEREGELLEPDIIIGLGMAPGVHRFSGYSRERVIEFGQVTGRLDPNGRPWMRGTGNPVGSTAVPTDKRGLRPSWWYADAHYYLSRSDLPVLWGMKPASVNMRAHRGRLPEADVVINTTMARGATYGYDPANIVHRSRQMGITVVEDPGPYHAKAVQQQ